MKNYPFEKVLQLILFFSFSLFLLFSCINLSSTYLYDWDEAIYAQVGKEMVAAKSIYGIWNGLPWLEKPPLVPFLSGLFMKLPGSTEFWARLPSFVAGIGVLYFLYKILHEKFKENMLLYFSITTVTLLLSAPFMNRMTSLNTDIFLVLGWLGFYYYYKKSFALSTLFLFVGVMSKSFLGLFPLLVVLLEDAFTTGSVKQALLGYLSNLRKLTMAILISIAWFVLAYLRFGNQFLQENLYDHLVARVVKPVELHYGGFLYYPKLLFSYYNVFLLVFAIAVGYVMYLIFKKRQTHLLFIPLFLLYGVLISLAKTKLNWYIFPILPFLAVSLSVLLVDIKTKLKLSVHWVWIGLIGIFLGGIFLQGSYVLRLKKEGPAPLTALALYAKEQCSKTTIIANNEELKFYDVINAANVQISSTFRYGGSPAFRFYADQPVIYRYDKNPNRDIVDHSNCIVVAENTSYALHSQEWDQVQKKGGFVIYKHKFR